VAFWPLIVWNNYICFNNFSSSTDFHRLTRILGGFYFKNLKSVLIRENPWITILINENTMISPFKFLDAYQKEDAKRFFGRDRETAQLYNAVFASNLTLLYGASGTGKTSLVNCGLSNKFYETDWLPLFIRRNTDVNEALNKVLKQAYFNELKIKNLELKAANSNENVQNNVENALNSLENAQNTEGSFSELKTSENVDVSLQQFENGAIQEKISRLYRACYKPIFLIFDQFEELFILGTRDEAAAFYKTIKAILDSDIQAKIILIVREEWMAYLNDFERFIPYLFENRLRVEKPDDRNLFKIVGGTLKVENITIQEPALTIRAILDNIRDRREGVDLTNLQVYLDRVFREAAAKNQGKTVVFEPNVVKKVGEMKNVISQFLDEQLVGIEADLIKRGIAKPKGLPLEMLFALISDDGTKKQSDLATILDSLPKNAAIKEADIAFCINEFKRIRILRELE
jgi:AAA ATPase domain